MWRSVGRTAVVLLGFVALLVAAQYLLTREDRPRWRMVLEVESLGADGAPESWEAGICQRGRVFLNQEPSSLEKLMERLQAGGGKMTAVARDLEGESAWRLVRDDQGRLLLDGRSCSWVAVRAKIQSFLAGQAVVPTRPVTVEDVLKARIPCPTVRKVSLPGFSYKEAYPEATDEPEVVITRYRGHPMHDDPRLVPEKLAPYYPQELPPVEERLPVNPAVVRGCDGIGKYSTKDRPMVWRRCGPDDMYLLQTKIGYPALVRFDPSGRLQPHIAWKWDVSDDNRVYTFYLRRGMKWSDGRPYTTEDILFALNTVIGSPAAPATPDWMQETDGANMIYAEDVRDWVGLAGKICEQASSGRPSPGSRLRKVIEADKSGRLRVLWEMLERIAEGRHPSEDEQYQLLGRLNSALTSEEFYEAVSWAGVDFRRELEHLKSKGCSRLSKEELERLELLLLREDWLRHADNMRDQSYWKPGEVTQFNVLMFREAFRDFVAPARRQRCRVEAVPDENGDSRYTLRFTFSKPNSIFLETAATFMFYLGHYNMQKAHRCRYLAGGYELLDIFDILKWRELLESLRKSGESEEPSPGKQIWSLLSSQMKARLLAGLPQQDRGKDEAYKTQIVAELNRLFGRRDFFQPQAWAKVDLDSELSRLLAAGFGSLQARQRRRVLELLRRQDLLRRGVDDLDEKELFEFNLTMFRAAYDLSLIHI